MHPFFVLTVISIVYIAKPYKQGHISELTTSPMGAGPETYRIYGQLVQLVMVKGLRGVQFGL